MRVLQPRICRNTSGLGSSPFARRYLGNSYWSLFLPVLRCFSSRRLLPFGLLGCPIRRFMDLRLFASTHDFSQLTTSFIASECLGIRHVPLITFSSRTSSLACLRPQSFPFLNLSNNFLNSLNLANYVLPVPGAVSYHRVQRDRIVCGSSAFNCCGEYRSRTDDLLLAKQAL